MIRVFNSLGIETQPLNVSDLSLEKAEEVLPSRLQQFLRWLIRSQRSSEEEQVDIEDQPEAEDCDLAEAKLRNILAIGQDIVTYNSGGRNKMPKNVGIG